MYSVGPGYAVSMASYCRKHEVSEVNIKSVGSHLNLASDPYAATQEDLFATTCCPYRYTQVLVSAEDLGEIVL